MIQIKITEQNLMSEAVSMRWSKEMWLRCATPASRGQAAGHREFLT